MCTHNNVMEYFSIGYVICAECGLVMDKILVNSNQPRGQEEEFTIVHHLGTNVNL